MGVVNIVEGSIPIVMNDIVRGIVAAGCGGCVEGALLMGLANGDGATVPFGGFLMLPTMGANWWVGIVAIAAILVRFEERRRRQVRTLYVSPKSLYSSELGMVGIGEAGAVETMRGMLGQLKYGFDSKGLPDRKKFDYRFIVRTDEFKEHDEESGKPADNAAAGSTAQRKDPTWKGTVIKIDRQNGNSETSFDGIDQLKAALA